MASLTVTSLSPSDKFSGNYLYDCILSRACMKGLQISTAPGMKNDVFFAIIVFATTHKLPRLEADLTIPFAYECLYKIKKPASELKAEPAPRHT